MVYFKITSLSPRVQWVKAQLIDTPGMHWPLTADHPTSSWGLQMSWRQAYHLPSCWLDSNYNVNDSVSLHTRQSIHMQYQINLITSVWKSHRSASLRSTTLEEDGELFVDILSISCFWFEIKAMRTYNFFHWVSNTTYHTTHHTYTKY